MYSHQRQDCFSEALRANDLFMAEHRKPPPRAAGKAKALFRDGLSPEVSPGNADAAPDGLPEMVGLKV